MVLSSAALPIASKRPILGTEVNSMMGLPVGETVCRAPHDVRKSDAQSHSTAPAKKRSAVQRPTLGLLRGARIPRRVASEIGAPDWMATSSKSKTRAELSHAGTGETVQI